MNLSLISKASCKCAPFNDTKKIILSKMSLVPCFVGMHPHILYLLILSFISVHGSSTRGVCELTWSSPFLSSYMMTLVLCSFIGG